MDEENLSNLEKLQAASQEKPAFFGLLRNFDPTAGSGASVPDPYYGGKGGFEEVLDQCERACAGLVKHLLHNELS